MLITESAREREVLKHSSSGIESSNSVACTSFSASRCRVCKYMQRIRRPRSDPSLQIHKFGINFESEQPPGTIRESRNLQKISVIEETYPRALSTTS